LLHDAAHRDGFGNANVVHHDGFFDGSLLFDGAELLKLIEGGEEDYARAGITQHKGDLLRRLRRVNGNDDSTKEGSGKLSESPLRSVFAEDSDAIAFLHTPFRQGDSNAHDAAIDFLAGNWVPLA